MWVAMLGVAIALVVSSCHVAAEHAQEQDVSPLSDRARKEEHKEEKKEGNACRTSGGHEADASAEMESEIELRPRLAVQLGLT